MLIRSKIKTYLVALLLVVISTGASLALGESVVRVLFDPVDYLKAYLVDDDILNHRIRPGSAGHDRWGFRNRSVPVSAQIVAIGDSQTYGVSAPGNRSWPAQLQNMTGKTVYNLSLGGYGPVHYYHLLKSKALELTPDLITVGFYFGNDLFDAYNLVYGKEYWRHLQRPHFLAEEESQSSSANVPSVRRRKALGNVRDWLAHHSVLYRMVTLHYGNIFRFFEMKYSAGGRNVTVLEDERHDIRTGLTPATRLRALNLDDPKVVEGLRLTLEIFRLMSDFCLSQGVRFAIVLIPTKESVFAPYIEKDSRLPTSSELNQLITNERRIADMMKDYFQRQNIAYVDVLGDLSEAVQQKRVYPANHDGHPNAEGYEIIAKAIDRFLHHSKLSPNQSAQHARSPSRE